jgi:hypothetical protein
VDLGTVVAAADGQVIDSDHQNAPFGEHPRRARIKVGIVFDESVHIPTAVGIVRAQQEPLSCANVVNGQVLRSTDLFVQDLDDPCWTNHRVNGEFVHSRRPSNEVDWRVDVSTTVDAERKVRDGRGVTSVEMLRLPQFNARVARILNHAISDSNCKVDPPVTTKNNVLRFHPALDLACRLAIRGPGLLVR